MNDHIIAVRLDPFLRPGIPAAIQGVEMVMTNVVRQKDLGFGFFSGATFEIGLDNSLASLDGFGGEDGGWVDIEKNDIEYLWHGSPITVEELCAATRQRYLDAPAEDLMFEDMP